MALIFAHWYLDLAFFIFGALGAFIWFLNNNFGYWKKRGIYHLKPELFFGNARHLILRKKNFADAIGDIYKDMSGHRFGGFYMSRLPALMVRDPDLIRNILVNDFSSFHDRGLISVIPKHDPLVHHLFNLEGYKWRALRTRLTPTFTSGRMKAMFSLIQECADQLGEMMPVGDIELKDTCQRFTTDVIGSCAFGLQCNALKNDENEFATWTKKIFSANFTENLTRLAVLLLPEVTNILQTKLVPQDVENFFMTVVKDAIRYREENNLIRPDFLHLLTQIQKKGVLEDSPDEKEETKKFSEGVKDMETDYHKGRFELTDDLLVAQCFVFFIGGFDTSSTLMSFALHELALNKDVQDKLHKEIKDVLSKHGGKITYEAVQEMVYLDKVVCEALRKYPPVPMLNRQAARPYNIPGTDIILEKGTKLWIPIYGLHYDPEYFPNPQKFDPERFSPENKAKRHNYSYLPFGEGPRNCIGMRFGLLQAKSGLAAIVSKFEINPCKKTSSPIDLDPQAFFSVRALDGNWVSVTPRAKT